jgi:hypothetical protein
MLYMRLPSVHIIIIMAVRRHRAGYSAKKNHLAVADIVVVVNKGN